MRESEPAAGHEDGLRAPQPHELVTRPSRVVFLIVALLSTAIVFDVPLAVTNSGRFAIYGTDFLIIPAIVILVIAVARKQVVFTRPLTVLFALAAIFFLYCFAVIVFRLAAGGHLDLQSMLIPRSNLAGVLFLLLFACGLFSLREILVSAFRFAVILAVVSAPLAVLDAYLPFAVFENLAIRTDYLFFLMPLLVFGLLKRRQLMLGRATVLLFAVSLGSLLFGAVVTGARVNAVFIPLMVALAALMIVMFGTKGRRLKDIGLSVVAPVAVVVVALVVIAPLVPRVQYGLERNPIYAFVVDQLAPSAPGDVVVSPSAPGSAGQNPTGTNAPIDPHEIAEEAARSADESTASRALVWEMALDDFRHNIWFGTGLKQYPITYVLDREYTSWIHPHNFAIEYLMAYGIFGFVLWIALLAYWPVRSFISSDRPESWRIAGAALTLSSFGLVWGASFVQPLMLYPSVLLVFYFIVGAFSRVLHAPIPTPRDGATSHD